MRLKLKKKENEDNHKCQTTVYLNGGLGNQLFQFANGIEISRTRTSSLYLDTRYLDQDVKRDYALDIFEIPQNKSFELSGSRMSLTSHDNKCTCEPIQIMESDFFYSDYTSQVHHKGHLFLHGYWQSPLYFRKSSELIKNFLNQSLDSQIETNYAVMHIRRGDFLSDSRTREFHGILDLEYYSRAVRIISKEINKIYLVSDNLSEASKILSKLAVLFPQNDFILTEESMSEKECISIMAYASFVITANSSFSWWGSYLGLEKTVIAPRNYFSSKTLRINNITDLYPTGWILI